MRQEIVATYLFARKEKCRMRQERDKNPEETSGDKGRLVGRKEKGRAI